jgi:hypothetical protein
LFFLEEVQSVLSEKTHNRMILIIIPNSSTTTKDHAVAAALLLGLEFHIQSNTYNSAEFYAVIATSASYLKNPLTNCVTYIVYKLFLQS